MKQRQRINSRMPSFTGPPILGIQVSRISAAETRERDNRGEEEYEHRTEGMPAAQAAAIAVEISVDRHNEESGLPTKTDAPMDADTGNLDRRGKGRVLSPSAPTF